GPTTNRRSIPRDLFSRTATIGWRSSNKSAVLLRSELQRARSPSKVVAPPTSRPKSTIRGLASGSAASDTLATRVGDGGGGGAAAGAAGEDGDATMAPAAGAVGGVVAVGAVAAGAGVDFSGCAWLRAEGGVGGATVGAGTSAGKVEEDLGPDAGLGAG